MAERDHNFRTIEGYNANISGYLIDDAKRSDKNPEKWSKEDEEKLDRYDAICSCSGRYDNYEPSDSDHAMKAYLTRKKQRLVKRRG